MSKLFVPKNYREILTPYETQIAIGTVKREFGLRLESALNLRRVSAPLMLEAYTGLNDDLNGIERPVEFDIAETNSNVQIVHSLAKWKRVALHRYGFPVGEGLYTDMNAIRRDEELDNVHSIYVDQWDWECIIDIKNRNLDYLKETVTKIVEIICETQEVLKEKFPILKTQLKKEVSFVTTQELEDLYPALSAKERENEYLKIHKTVCIMQIGDTLKSGKKHDGRAPDYDDWKLNCDILFWNDILQRALEVSSMGIRVDAKSLDEQLSKANCDERRQLTFHNMLLNNKLPLTIGGGIGQSRLCILLLEKAHIGEVQVSVWDSDTEEACKKVGINLL